MNYYPPTFYDRIGEESINNQGEPMKIIEYIDCDNITVMFKESKTIVKSTYAHFKNGEIKDKNFKNIIKKERTCIGNTTTKDKNGNTKKSYNVWKGIIDRCCDEKFQKEHQSYQGCSICDEWLCYENFEKWYNENYYEIDGEMMCVDKDILYKNNKIYSPDTCIIVPTRINSMFKHRRKNKSIYPIGVGYAADKKLFTATAKCGDVRKTTYHKTSEEAFYSHKEMKEKMIKQIADEYKDKIPSILYDAMYRYEMEITD